MEMDVSLSKPKCVIVVAIDGTSSRTGIVASSRTLASLKKLIV